MSEINSIPLPTNPRFKNLTGKVFTRLTVVGYAGTSVHGHSKWRVRCVCGTVKEVAVNDLSTGHARSCGCLKHDLAVAKGIVHNATGTPEYSAWQHMWKRCTNPKDKNYNLYKGRTPPPEWRSFEAFYVELGPRPGPGFSLERINNDLPYGPGNCRWATSKEQSRNMVTNVWVTTPDGQRLCLTDACKLIGLSRGMVKTRRYRGQTLEEASNGLLKLAA
jgi:hypothetical protein